MGDVVCGVLVRDAVADWLEMRWLIGGRRGGVLVGDVVVYWLEMRWLIGWRCGGSLVGRIRGSSLLGLQTALRHGSWDRKRHFSQRKETEERQDHSV